MFLICCIGVKKSPTELEELTEPVVTEPRLLPQVSLRAAELLPARPPARLCVCLSGCPLTFIRVTVKHGGLSSCFDTNAALSAAREMHGYEAPKEDMALYVLHTQLELGTSLGESPALWTSAFCTAIANQRAARRRAAWLAGRGFFQAARLQNDSSACKSSSSD